MKHIVSIFLTIILMLSLVSCSNGVTKEEYDLVRSKLDSANTTISSLEEQISVLQKEYDTYKEKMSEYEDLASAEVEARRIEAEAVIKAEKEAAAAAAAAAAAEAEAKARAGYETGITYDQLARTPDNYIGELVKFRGKVLQVVEGDAEINIRLAVNNNFDNVLFCGYSPDIVSSRILENDTITIYGESLGLYSYESTIGAQITIPAVWIDKIDQ
ncbi:MAG: toxin regulator [Clostridia bacterium]|nr:toxin regulator [Clostridia bacterium]